MSGVSMGFGSFPTPKLRNVRYFVYYTRGNVAVGFASLVGSFISRTACILGYVLFIVYHIQINIFILIWNV